MTPKPCASCPRRWVCLRCGDAVCSRCAASRACCERAAAERDVKPPDIFEQLCSLPQPSSAVPVPAPAEPPRRAAEAPAPSTTPRDCPPDAGGGRAVSPDGKRIADVALEMVARGPIYAGQLAERTGKPIESCRTTLWHLEKRGLLTYTPPAGGAGRGRSGQYRAAVPVEQLVLPPIKRTAPASFAPPPSFAAPPSDAELARVGARRVPVEQAATSASRAPVTGVHRSAADFFADTPKLPPARPIVPRYA